MLTKLDDIARLKRLRLENAEKDYLQELVLFSLYSQISNELIFKGGTCLYKLRKLNRFSEDLDFTLTKKINIEKVTKRIIADLSLVDIKSKIKEIDKHRNEINIRLIVNGPLYKGSKETQCFLPLNISLREKILLQPKKEVFTSLYKEIRDFEIFFMQEQEILAEKIRAILTREKPRDVYDLWFLLINKKINFNLKLVDKKLKIYNLKFNFDDFINAVERKRGLWAIDLKGLIIGDLPEFNNVKEEIILVLKQFK